MALLVILMLILEIHFMLCLQFAIAHECKNTSEPDNGQEKVDIVGEGNRVFR